MWAARASGAGAVHKRGRRQPTNPAAPPRPVPPARSRPRYQATRLELSLLTPSAPAGKCACQALAGSGVAAGAAGQQLSPRCSACRCALTSTPCRSCSSSCSGTLRTLPRSPRRLRRCAPAAPRCASTLAAAWCRRLMRAAPICSHPAVRRRSCRWPHRCGAPLAAALACTDARPPIACIHTPSAPAQIPAHPSGPLHCIHACTAPCRVTHRRQRRKEAGQMRPRRGCSSSLLDCYLRSGVCQATPTARGAQAGVQGARTCCLGWSAEAPASRTAPRPRTASSAHRGANGPLE